MEVVRNPKYLIMHGKLDSIGENGRRFVSTEFNVEGSIENYKERIVNLCLK